MIPSKPRALLLLLALATSPLALGNVNHSASVCEGDNNAFRLTSADTARPMLPRRAYSGSHTR